MNHIKNYLVLVLVLIFATTSFAQTQSAPTKTQTIKVSGLCDMCKSRIEKAVKIDGVVRAAWDLKTKGLTIVFNPSKVKIADLEKRVAAVGHDTPLYKASDKVYNALPSCCKYR